MAVLDTSLASITVLPYSHPAIHLDQCLASFRRGDVIRLAWLGHRKDRTGSKEKAGSTTQVRRDVRGFFVTCL